MTEQRLRAKNDWQGWFLAFVLCFCWAAAVPAQAPTAEKPRLTPDQARQLFSLVDELLKFSSQEAGLPIKSDVKRQIISRATVESFLKEKFEEDESAKRLQRGEIVLKKFGLLDRDFNLKPFLLALLKEQIEAYYDSKTKTVYMLDWVNIEEQKPVLAHELTHALQDQHSDLEKWSDQSPDEVSVNSAEDSAHIAKDEMDTAREAVVEGQATAVMMDYILKPMGKSLIEDPEVLDLVQQQMTASDSSPVLARAPLLLSESLLFPYREGLSFEQDVWIDQGQAAAFAGTMDRPPTSTWEIVNPREYERRSIPPIPLLPNIHPLVDTLYKPYDIGQVGQLDLRILTEIYSGMSAARDLTPAWDGGIYWAGQLRSAKTPADHPTNKDPSVHPSEQKSLAGDPESVGTPVDHPTDKDPSVGTPEAHSNPNSIALFYLSAWKNPASAQAFAKLYADNLGRKYSGLKPYSADASAGLSANAPGDIEQIYSTSEGPVLITTRGKLVFVAESFPLDLARKLSTLILAAQGTGELQQARIAEPNAVQSDSVSESVGTPSRRQLAPPQGSGAPGLDSETGEPRYPEPLTTGLIRFFSHCGVMKAAVETALEAAR